MPSIEIYTQDWCPYCVRAKQVLDRKGAAYKEIDAPGGSAARREACERSGGRTSVPQIFIGGQHIGGCDDLLDLDRAGKLDPLLKAA
jgi:glutaredoxin 3